MNDQQLASIPDDVMRGGPTTGATRLIDWLNAHGWRMTLLELDEERRRRSMRRAGR